MYNYPINRFPKKGYVLGYFKEKLVFEPYEILDGRIVFSGSEILDHEMPEKIHFFDQNKEFRIISREFRNDFIEKEYTESEEALMDPDLIFVEDVLVKKEFQSIDKLRIVNRYEYSENDTLVLKNYRIALL